MTGEASHVPDGFLVVDKPLGWSSMAVVRKVRQAVRMGLAEGVATGRRKVKVGHAGTLDPLATGVVVCCVGKATRLVERVMGLAKMYEAKVDLSAFTVGDDLEGEREEVAVAEPPSREAVERALAGFVGEVEQVPPAFSALKVGGRRAYELARAGEVVSIQPRMVRIYEAALLGYDWPVASVRVVCGRGTYIRSLARDLGKSLGTGGHLAGLRRTAVGGFDLSVAVVGERLKSAVVQADLLPVTVVADEEKSPG